MLESVVRFNATIPEPGGGEIASCLAVPHPSMPREVGDTQDLRLLEHDRPELTG